MQHFFIPKIGLGYLIELLGPKLNDVNWLFVTLDSSRGELLRVREHLTPQLENQHVAFWWSEEGLWLPGKELMKDFIMDKVVVGFSAAFIFQSTIKRSAKPHFSDTTDHGEFSDQQLQTVSQEIKTLQAMAYVADGTGLQCVFAEEDIYRFITTKDDGRT